MSKKKVSGTIYLCSLRSAISVQAWVEHCEAHQGLVYHVLNRANGRVRIFENTGDYKAFEQVMAQARERVPKRVRLKVPGTFSQSRS